MAVGADDDSAPNYGAILRICQDGLEAASGSGGVLRRGEAAHIEQTVAEPRAGVPAGNPTRTRGPGLPRNACPILGQN
jgi:hypothetical protein